jgi:hypothetical protein
VNVADLDHEDRGEHRADAFDLEQVPIVLQGPGKVAILGVSRGDTPVRV